MTEEFVHHADLPHYKTRGTSYISADSVFAIESASFMTSPTHPPTYLPIQARAGIIMIMARDDRAILPGRFSSLCAAAAEKSKKPDEIEHKSLARREWRALPLKLDFLLFASKIYRQASRRLINWALRKVKKCSAFPTGRDALDTFRHISAAAGK